MAVFMLDAGTCVAILKRTEVLQRLSALPVKLPVRDVCISAITHSELMFGLAMSRREAQDRAVLDLFLKYVAVLEYPRGAAEHYGEIRMALELLDAMVGANDLLVAAHARCLGLTLVTGQHKKLCRAPGLSVESWAA